jgi:hypothetical protein
MAYTPHYKRNPDEQRHYRLDKIGIRTAIVGVIVVAISTIVSLWSALIVQHQSKIMASQQRIMEAQQRPWISVEVFPRDPIKFEKNGSFQLFYTAKAKNVGQTAAAGVDVDSEIVSLDWSDAAGIRKEQNRFCDNIRNETFRTPDSYGFLLFPGEEHIFVQMSTIMAKSMSYKVSNDGSGKKAVNLMIIGCADYQFYVSKDHHQTRFAYVIQRLDKGTFDYYYTVVKGPKDEEVFLRDVVVRSDVPSELLRFNRGLWGNGYAD